MRQCNNTKPLNKAETQDVLQTPNIQIPVLWGSQKIKFEDGSRIEVYDNHFVVRCNDAIYSVTFDHNINYDTPVNWNKGVYITFIGDLSCNTF